MRCFSMNTTADKKSSAKAKGINAEQCMRPGRIFTGDCCCYVKTYGGTWADTTDACWENELHPTVYLQSAEGAKNMSLETIRKIESALCIEIRSLNENEQ